MVLEKTDTGDWEGHGTQEFEVAPKTGEYISFDDNNGIGQIFEVVAVIHPLSKTMTAGDLIIRYVSDNVEFKKSL